MAGTRKIAAILVADIVGYSRLAGADEERTLSRLRGLRSDLIDRDRRAPRADRQRPVTMSSTMPSTKYSCSASPLMFWNGKTAIEGLSGSARRSGSDARAGLGLAATPTCSA